MCNGLTRLVDISLSAMIKTCMVRVLPAIGVLTARLVFALLVLFVLAKTASAIFLSTCRGVPCKIGQPKLTTVVVPLLHFLGVSFVAETP